MRTLARIVIVSVLGASLVTSGFLVFSEVAGRRTDDGTRATLTAQDALRDELAARPAADRPAARVPHPVARPVAEGDPLGTIEIPRFGEDWRWVMLQGVADDVIADGPGHYLDTALPGAVGNVGIAAHRAGHGDPFIDFDRLRVGDEVRLSQDGVTWVYRLDTAPRIIPVTATWVLRPRTDGGRELTLTTCWPKYGSSKRMFVHATLARVIGEPADARANPREPQADRWDPRAPVGGEAGVTVSPVAAGTATRPDPPAPAAARGASPARS